MKNIDVRDTNPGCQIFVPPIEKEKGTRYFYLFLDEAHFLNTTSLAYVSYVYNKKTFRMQIDRRLSQIKI